MPQPVPIGRKNRGAQDRHTCKHVGHEQASEGCQRRQKRKACAGRYKVTPTEPPQPHDHQVQHAG